MKKFSVPTGISLALAVSLLCALPALAAAKSQLYRDPRLKFSLRYPAGYTVKTVGSAVVFSAPLSGRGDSFPESLNVVVVGMADYPGSVESFYLRSKKSLLESMPYLRIVDEDTAAMAGRTAWRLHYTAMPNTTPFEFLQVMLENRGLAYLLTYTAQPGSYEEYLPAMEEILASFSFID